MNTSVSDTEKSDAKPAKSGKNLRQYILLGILLFVLGAFLLDRYVLMPSAEAKINQITSEVTNSLSKENRAKVQEIAGRKPSRTFTYGGYDIDQYRFPRGLPFYSRPVLDIAYKDDAIAFFSQLPMTEEYIDSKQPTYVIDNSRADERKNLKATMGN